MNLCLADISEKPNRQKWPLDEYSVLSKCQMLWIFGLDHNAIISRTLPVLPECSLDIIWYVVLSLHLFPIFIVSLQQNKKGFSVVCSWRENLTLYCLSVKCTDSSTNRSPAGLAIVHDRFNSSSLQRQQLKGWSHAWVSYPRLEKYICSPVVV